MAHRIYRRRCFIFIFLLFFFSLIILFFTATDDTKDVERLSIRKAFVVGPSPADKCCLASYTVTGNLALAVV